MSTQILVVEDEKIVAKDITEMLASRGYEVSSVASSGEEAVEKAREQHPSLVLMDIKLRGSMDGIEAAQEIRDTIGTPVVFLTAYADDGTVARVKSTEPYGYILKPFDEWALCSAIEVALARHRAEAKLKQSHQLVLNSLKLFNVGVIAVDTDGLVIYMNSIAEDMVGVGLSDAIETDLARVFRLLRKNAGETAPRENIARPAMKSNDTIFYGMQEYVLELHDKRLVPVEAYATPIHDDAGTVTGCLVVFRKVHVQEKLDDGTRLVGKLAVGVATDLESTLNSVENSVHLLGMRQDLPEDLQVNIESISKQLGHAHSVARNLLKVSGASVSEMAHIDLAQFTIELTKVYRNEIPENVDVSVEHLPGEYPITGNAFEIQQIFLNLVRNAAEAMPDGGEITVKMATKELKKGDKPPFTGMNLGKWVVLEVEDTGIGIQPDQLPLIFEPFFTTKNHSKREGFGLSRVYSYIKRHRGFVTVKSTPNKGTTFTIYFPSAEME